MRRSVEELRSASCLSHGMPDPYIQHLNILRFPHLLTM